MFRTADHFISREEWPWDLLPPFLDPHVMMFSQDTLPLLLQQAGRVPVMKYPEIWLSSLLALRAGVIRVGLKDWFGPVGRDRRGRCDWSTVAAVWGVETAEKERDWVKHMQRTTCPPPQEHQQRDQCLASPSS